MQAFCFPLRVLVGGGGSRNPPGAQLLDFCNGWRGFCYVHLPAAGFPLLCQGIFLYFGLFCVFFLFFFLCLLFFCSCFCFFC